VWLYGADRRPEAHLKRFQQLRVEKLKTGRAWAMRSRLGPIKKVARCFKEHFENIVTYFKHRISNAALEGQNNQIAGLVKKAFGYRNRERFKTDSLFHLGGLDLYPAQ
jgi:transposase